MTAKLLMNPNPVFLRTSDTIAEGAMKIMAKQRRSLPVVDDEGRFQGMLTANCLLYLCLPKAATMDQGLDNLSYVKGSLDDIGRRLQRHLDEPVTRCLKAESEVPVVYPDTSTIETLLVLYNAKSNVSVIDPETHKLLGMISYYDVGAKILETIPDSIERYEGKS